MVEMRSWRMRSSRALRMDAAMALNVSARRPSAPVTAVDGDAGVVIALAQFGEAARSSSEPVAHPGRAVGGAQVQIRDAPPDERVGLDICYDVGQDAQAHPLVGRRIPDLDLRTADGPTRVSTLLHGARPVVLNLGAAGTLDALARPDRVAVVEAGSDGEWELPLLGCVAPPVAVLIRPDGHVRVGRGSHGSRAAVGAGEVVRRTGISLLTLLAPAERERDSEEPVGDWAGGARCRHPAATPVAWAAGGQGASSARWVTSSVIAVLIASRRRGISSSVHLPTATWSVTSNSSSESRSRTAW